MSMNTAYIKNTSNQRTIAEHEYEEITRINRKIDGVFAAHTIPLTQPKTTLTTTPNMPRLYADPTLPENPTTTGYGGYVPVPWPW